MIFSKYQNGEALSRLDSDKWRFIKFSKVLENETSKAVKIKKKDYLDAGEFPIIDQGKEYIAGYASSNEGIYKNTPIIIFGDHTRVIKYVDFPIFIGADGVKLLKNKYPEDEVLTKYLYYYLCSVNIPDTGYNRHFKYIKDIVFPIPSIDNQKRIVTILEKSQDLIKKRKKQIELLDNLTQSVFIEMFGDPIINNKGWETVALEEVIVLQRGFDLPTKQRNLNGNIKVYGSNGVLSYHDEPKVKGGGIITGRSGTIGNVYFTYDDFWPLNTTLFSIETYNNNLVYLKYLLEYFKLNRFVNGTGVPTLNRNIVHKKKVYNVPINLQNNFSEVVFEIEKQKEKLITSLTYLEDNYNSLLLGAFKDDLIIEE